MQRGVRAGFLIVLAGLLAPVVAEDELASLSAAEKLVEMRHWHEANRLVQNVLKENPKDPRIHALLGQIYFGLSRFKDCRDSFDICMSEDAERYEKIANAFYARLAYLNGDSEGARAHLEKADGNEQFNRSLLMLLDLKGGQRKQTAHFYIYVDGGLAKAGAAEAAAATLEIVYELYSKMFPIKVEKVLQPIVIFSDRAKFEEVHTVLQAMVPSPEHIGIMNPALRVILVHNNPANSQVVDGGLTDETIRNLYNMAFSQFREMICPNSMPWFEHGMGHYASEAEFNKGKPKLGTYRRRVADGKTLSQYEMMKDAFKQRQFLPLSTTLALEEKDFLNVERRRAFVNVAQAWSFIHFLIHSKQFPKGKKLLLGYFTALHEGYSLQEAYAKAFGQVDMAKLEAMWLSYIETM